MALTLYWLAGVTLAELLLWTPFIWRQRRVWAAGVIVVLSVASGLLFGAHPAVWTGMVLILSIYRLINLLRVIEARMQAKQLYVVTCRTGWWLISLQLTIAAIVYISDRFWLNAAITWLEILCGVQLVAATILWTSASRSLRTTSVSAGNNYSDHDLPTLSVLIPARNETEDLESCLQSLITSDYPKLEILVLDDCSQNKRTPGIIRDFAQSGVVFVDGSVPPDTWLAKNFAYRQLTEKANGELLLFCGVDTRFQPGTLRAMVTAMLTKQKNMMSFIPRNLAPDVGHSESLLIQPARYAWELSLPRRFIQRPPVLSTCWLITANALHGSGGFEAVSHSISPESYFARWNALHSDSYSFVQSNKTIGLVSTKSTTEQRATAVRTRYPQLHRRPELVALVSLSALTVLVLPFAVLIGCLATRHWPLFFVSLITSALLVSFYTRIVTLTYRRFLWRSLWLLPFAALYDVGLLKYSMWRYEFRDVIWKGRNVCLPVFGGQPHSRPQNTSQRTN